MNCSAMGESIFGEFFSELVGDAVLDELVDQFRERECPPSAVRTFRRVCSKCTFGLSYGFLEPVQ